MFQEQSDSRYKFLTTSQTTEAELNYFQASNANFLTEKIITAQKAVSGTVQEVNNNQKNKN